MRKFVQPRRGNKRIIIRTEAKKASGRKLFLYYHRQKVAGALIIGSILYMLFFFNRSPIQHVEFSQSTQSQLQYDEAFTSIAKGLVGTGYIKWKLGGQGSWNDSIRKQFPLIQKLDIVSFTNGTLTLDITFAQPDFLMKTQDNVDYIAYRNMVIPFVTGSTLGISGLKITLALPDEQLQQFSGGIFRKISSPEIARNLKQITFLSGAYSTTYYPGREKGIIKNGNRTYIFSLDTKKLQETFVGWKKILPYLPTAAPVQLDLSSTNRIIIK